jgi:heme/copper-type cytochrome/quinol oxidase subunit 2
LYNVCVTTKKGGTPMMRKWFLLSVLLLSLISLTACGGAEKETAKPAEPTDGTEQAVNISATNFAFNEEEFSVKAGQPVKISFKSEQGVHGIAISGTDVNLNDGDSETVTLEAGEYNIICTIPCGSGHTQMVSKLVVS